jgi:hypothetical protein
MSFGNFTIEIRHKALFNDTGKTFEVEFMYIRFGNFIVINEIYNE